MLWYAPLRRAHTHTLKLNFNPYLKGVKPQGLSRLSAKGSSRAHLSKLNDSKCMRHRNHMRNHCAREKSRLYHPIRARRAPITQLMTKNPGTPTHLPLTALLYLKPFVSAQRSTQAPCHTCHTWQGAAHHSCHLVPCQRKNTTRPLRPSRCLCRIQ